MTEQLKGAVLEARDITVRFGGFVAVRDASLVAKPGQVTSLIGPNGAGKTTMFHAISGILTPEAGSTLLDGRDLKGMTPDKRARAGMARTFQILELFSGLSVAENLQVAVEGRSTSRIWRDLFSLRHPDSPAVLRRVHEAMDLVGIADLADRPAGSLPTGLSRLAEVHEQGCDELTEDQRAKAKQEREPDRCTDEIGDAVVAVRAECLGDEGLRSPQEPDAEAHEREADDAGEANTRELRRADVRDEGGGGQGHRGERDHRDGDRPGETNELTARAIGPG